jgi:lipooligosaccharide transport system permease protein
MTKPAASTLQLSWLLVVRHWRVYRKYFWSNILPTVIEPCFFIVALGLGMSAFVNEIDGLSYAAFMGPGLAMSAAMFTAFFETSYGFYVRLTMEGIYKAVFTTQIQPRHVIFGELLWVSIKGGIMAMVVAMIFVAFGFVDFTINLLGVGIVGFIVGSGCGGIGLIASSLIKNISQFQTVYALAISPLFFFSGSLFPMNHMPQWAQIVAHASPLYHGVVLSQQLLWQRISYPIFAIHFCELVVLNFIFTAIAYKLVYRKLIQ